MAQPTPIVIVTGPPAAGKSTVAGSLAAGLRLPLIAKDPVKEALFDALGHDELEWTRRLGRAVYPLLFHMLESQLRAGRSCVIEANFDHERAAVELRSLQERLRFRAFQVVCTGAPDVLVARYAARAGTRHPGHFDELRVDEVREAVEAGRWRVLRLDGEAVEVDTTDWDAVDLGALAERVRAWLAETPDAVG